ncbi:MAG: dienelactone hydrolase family protein [Polaromonas sp.]|nr:dienelactone hydrolase family protein [Gemmatimonadaceae bacterium]
MNAVNWQVAVGADTVSASYEPSTAGADSAVFVFAHGAGGNMSDRGMLASANALRNAGLGVVRFNFVYKEKKSGRPDAMPKLMDTVRAVIERTRLELASPRPLVIGGRSMGGRAASMLAADGFDADGLLLLAYPLHPAGQPEKLRDAHLPRITMPVLAFSGTRDALCTRELMEQTLTSVVAPWEMHWIDGADHSFHVLKSSGTTDVAVMADIGAMSGRWVKSLLS